MDSRKRKLTIILELFVSHESSSSTESSSSDDSSEGDEKTPLRTLAKTEFYAERTVPAYTDLDFRKTFRVSRLVFEKLLEAISVDLLPDGYTEGCRGRMPIPPPKVLMIGIFTLATKVTYRYLY
jgi:hypothetical protein